MKNITLKIGATSIVTLLISSSLMAAPAQWDHESSQGVDGRAWAQMIDPTSSSPAPLNYPYATCGVGSNQTPISVNLSGATVTTNTLTGLADKNPTLASETISNPINLNYPVLTNAAVVNNGHAVQVNFPISYPGQLLLGQDAYPLVQFHFHTPSEHSVISSTTGKQTGFAGEIHFVHQRADGKLLVLAVLLDTSTGIETPAVSNALDTILNSYPFSLNQTATVTSQFNPNNLLPIGNSPIVTYTGSLTTPPCTEGVIWYILGSPIQVSAAHIQAINSLVPNNNRITQNTNGRTVQLHNRTSGGY